MNCKIDFPRSLLLREARFAESEQQQLIKYSKRRCPVHVDEPLLQQTAFCDDDDEPRAVIEFTEPCICSEKDDSP